MWFALLMRQNRCNLDDTTSPTLPLDTKNTSVADESVIRCRCPHSLSFTTSSASPQHLCGVLARAGLGGVQSEVWAQACDWSCSRLRMACTPILASETHGEPWPSYSATLHVDEKWLLSTRSFGPSSHGTHVIEIRCRTTVWEGKLLQRACLAWSHSITG